MPLSSPPSSFIIQAKSGALWYLQDISQAGTPLWGFDASTAIKFNSINIAIAFNRIIGGEIIKLNCKKVLLVCPNIAKNISNTPSCSTNHNKGA